MLDTLILDYLDMTETTYFSLDVSYLVKTKGSIDLLFNDFPVVVMVTEIYIFLQMVF